MDKKQTTLYSKKELELIKNTFGGDGEKNLLAVRNIFFQFPFSEPLALDEEIIEIIKKTILPEPSGDIPLGIIREFWLTLASLRETLPEIAIQHIKAHDKAKAYLEERLSVLYGAEETSIVLKDLKEQKDKSDSERFIDLLAYQFLTGNYIDSCLMNLQVLANAKEETKEEQEERLKKGSSK